MPKNNYDDDDDDDDLLMALQSMEPCGNCGADGAKIPCMSGCGEVFYCSRVGPGRRTLERELLWGGVLMLVVALCMWVGVLVYGL